MKMWVVFVILTVICWGAYVPTLHHGQMAIGKNSQLRAFLFVGAAYAIVSVAVLAYLMVTKAEPWEFTSSGTKLSLFAGLLGAVGALGIIFALKGGGTPLIVPPLVFAGAPIVNTLVAMIWSPPAKPPSVLFYAGIVLACAGAAMALRFKPT